MLGGAGGRDETNMKDKAIAFDFDGTLVHSGYDKGVHIMYSAYVACAATGFRCFLHPGDPGLDVERLLRGLLQYPGAPRFQQLAALVNSLIHDRPVAVEVPAGLGVEPELAAEYEGVRRTYDTAYTELNDAAAAKHWKAYPTALEAIPRLAADFDLYIASGVPPFSGHLGCEPAGRRRQGRDPAADQGSRLPGRALCRRREP